MYFVYDHNVLFYNKYCCRSKKNNHVMAIYMGWSSEPVDSRSTHMPQYHTVESKWHRGSKTSRPLSCWVANHGWKWFHFLPTMVSNWNPAIFLVLFIADEPSRNINWMQIHFSHQHLHPEDPFAACPSQSCYFILVWNRHGIMLDCLPHVLIYSSAGMAV